MPKDIQEATRPLTNQTAHRLLHLDRQKCVTCNTLFFTTDDGVQLVKDGQTFCTIVLKEAELWMKYRFIVLM
jgi:hypothetical protein